MKDIIIIGAGPAGLTAAVYACRAAKSVLVLEKELIGGQITYSHKIENYPSVKEISGADFASNLFEQATSLGAEVELESVVEIVDNGKTKTVITSDNKHEAKVVILATGVKSRQLGVPGEENLVGRGVSYCAVCDGAFFKNKPVAVIGGGNTALQDAMLLSGYCSEVYLIHRRDEFRGEASLVQALKKRENVKFVLNSQVNKINGEETVESIEVENNKTKETQTISLDGVFVAVGQIPNNQAFENVVELDEQGFIVASEDCKTKTNGVFVAGDCRAKAIRQLTTAAADGAVSSISACELADKI